MTEKNLSFSLPVVILCEEVRKEISFKDTILGAVPSGLSVMNFPASIRCAFWLVAETDGLAEGKYTLCIFFKNEANPDIKYHEFNIDFFISENKKTTMSLATNVGFLNVEEPCSLQLWYSLQSGKPQFIRNIAFEKLKPPTLPILPPAMIQKNKV